MEKPEKKHDIEEFSAVVDRHGVYQRDLEAFALIVIATGLFHHALFGIKVV